MQTPYRYIIQHPLPVLDPVLLPKSQKSPILMLVCQRLVRLNDDFQPIPDLAKSWRISRKDQTILFELGVSHFHNGKRVTAQDVKSSLARTMEAGLLSASHIKSIEVVSEYEVRIHLKDLAFEIFIKSLSDPDHSIIFEGKVTRPLIGSGPYRIVEASVGGTKFVLESLEDKPDTRPNRIEFVHYETAQAIRAMEENKADEYITSFLVTSDGRPPANAHEIGLFYPITTALVLSTHSRIFSVRENRLEFAAIFPREEMVRELYPFASLAQSIVPSALLDSEEEYLPYSQAKLPVNTTSAKRAVIFGNYPGEDPNVFMRVANSPEMRSRGWNIQMRMFPTPEEVLNAVRAGEIDGHLEMMMADYYDPITILQRFTSAVSPRSFKEDAKLSALIESIYSTQEGHRKHLYQLTAQYIHDEAYGIPLAEAQVRKFIRKGAPKFINQLTIPFWYDLGFPRGGGEDIYRRLNQAYSSLRSTQSRLKVERELSRLALKVSHDIRSPLTALQVLEKTLTFGSKEQGELFKNAVRRINEISEVLLSKGTSKQNVPQGRTVSINQAISEIAEELKPQFKSKIKIASHDELELGVSESDLKRALTNLARNALEASGEGSFVEIQTSTLPGQILISVVDQGKGIPADVLRQLREGAEITYGKAGGHGLGLQQVREFVEENGGRLALDSRVGDGTVVTMIFPRPKIAG